MPHHGKRAQKFPAPPLILLVQGSIILNIMPNKINNLHAIDFIIYFVSI